MNLFENLSKLKENNTPPTSEIAIAIQDLWNINATDMNNTNDYLDYFKREFGWEDITPEQFNNAWELACEDTPEAEEDFVVIDGEEIRDRSDANRWLQSKVAEYGNTYFFNDTDKMTLNQLIDKFGNTYFWSR